MMRTLLSNRPKNDKKTHKQELGTQQSIKSLRIGQKILNNFHINHISKDKSKTTKLSKTNRRIQCLKAVSIDDQGLSFITNSSIFPKQSFKPSNTSSNFYKRERNQQEQHNNESHTSFAQRFASFPVKNRSIADRHRRITRMRNVVVSDRNMTSQRKVKTEYDEQQGDHGDSSIFRSLQANAFSEGKIQLEGPPHKLRDTKKDAINLTNDRILLPKYQRKQQKVMESLRKVTIDEDVLGPRQHPYSCILKPPQRFSYGKYNSTYQQIVKSTKRP